MNKFLSFPKRAVRRWGSCGSSAISGSDELNGVGKLRQPFMPIGSFVHDYVDLSIIEGVPTAYVQTTVVSLAISVPLCTSLYIEI